ncbi:MAG: DUF4271 domain-containing protein [Alistipes sp.]|nr:DUF4271 domain-containing protein [Alistipes sp.]
MSLPILYHNITPEQAFGEASVFVAESAAAAGQSVSYGALFQIAVLVIGFAYTFFIVRYWDFLRYFIISALGVHQGSGDKAHINPGEQTNIEVVMIILGVLTLALCALRGVGMWGAEALTDMTPSVAAWVVTLVALGAILLTLGYQFGTVYLSAAVCERGDMGRALAGIKSLYLAVGFVAVIPFGILFLLSASTVATVGFWGAILCALIAVIVFVKETFFFFVSQKISILHWILYLCALEIFPASLILAPFLR